MRINDKDVLVVMMAAGAGSRFKGHQTPKPYIQIHGYPMCEYVAHQMGFHSKGVRLVAQVAHKGYAYRMGGMEVCFIPPMIESGPAGSVIMGTSDYDARDHAGLLLLDCDSFVSNIFKLDGSPISAYDVIEQNVEQFQKDYTAAAVFTVIAREDSPHEALVDISIDKGTRILEGGVSKNSLLNTGIYYFSSFDAFRTAAMVLFYQHPGKEIKLSDVFNLISGSGKVAAPVLDGIFTNLGTPETLHSYLTE